MKRLKYNKVFETVLTIRATAHEVPILFYLASLKKI